MKQGCANGYRQALLGLAGATVVQDPSPGGLSPVQFPALNKAFPPSSRVQALCEP
jgi:hypothetical protein